MIEKYGRDWRKVAATIKTRDATMLKNRYYYLAKKGIVDKDKNKWVYGKGIYDPEKGPY